MKFSRRRADQCGVRLSQIILAETHYNVKSGTMCPEAYATWVRSIPEDVHWMLTWMPPGSIVCGPGLTIPAPRRAGVIIGYANDARHVIVSDLEAIINVRDEGVPPYELVPPKRLSLLACVAPATREYTAEVLGVALPEHRLSL